MNTTIIRQAARNLANVYDAHRIMGILLTDLEYKPALDPTMNGSDPGFHVIEMSTHLHEDGRVAGCFTVYRHDEDRHPISEHFFSWDDVDQSINDIIAEIESDY